MIDKINTRVCAVVTTYSPDKDFPARINNIQTQVNVVVIVNDGATEDCTVRLKEWFDEEDNKIVLLHHASNRGIAAALNTGLQWAENMGIAYAVLLDDDSRIAPGMVGKLVAAFEQDLKQAPAILGVSCRTVGEGGHDKTGERIRLREVPTVITAGSMIPLKIYRDIGPFREELFIDYVDHEYCLRARLRGVQIWQSVEVGLEQPVGQSQKTAWGELRSTHSPSRTYYFFRNSLAVARENVWRFPGFLIWVGWQQFKTIMKIIFFMRPKRQYCRAMARGWADGWNRRFGRIKYDIAML